MISIDTNVLVRYLVNDDKRQSKIARELFEKAVQDNDRIFVNIITLIETIWVLELSYKFKKSELINVIKDLLDYEIIALECEQRIESALSNYTSGKADFSDCLSTELSLHRAHSKLYTFDKKCKEQALFVFLK
ncbi:MAG: PIN domain-containing protein [Chitinivibrionales bacterium]|nr:PIN domain-containing protein [Chitinivibrionales bacterium]